MDAGVDVVDAGPGALVWMEAAPCPLPRFEAMGAAVDGEVWVMGGFTSGALAVTARVDIYDPESDTWRRGADVPVAETHSGTAVDGNQVFLVGGMRGWPPTVVASAHRWRDGAWQALPDLPDARAAMALVVTGGILHAVGGLAADGNSDSESHAVLRVDGEDGWTAAAGLPNARNHLGGAAVMDTVFVVGGRHGWDESAGHQGSMHALVDGAWMERAAVPFARSEIGASVIALGDGLVVIGGSTMGVQPTDSVVRYRISGDTWEALTPLPEPRKGAVAERVGRKIVVTTGSPTSTDPSGTTWIGCCVE